MTARATPRVGTKQPAEGAVCDNCGHFILRVHADWWHEHSGDEECLTRGEKVWTVDDRP